MLKIELKKLFIDYYNLFLCNEITAKRVNPFGWHLLKLKKIYKAVTFSDFVTVFCFKLNKL